MTRPIGGDYHLVFVGGGMACTMTLLELSRLLASAAPSSETLRIAVIEKTGEFWSGVAYGVRSSVNSLVLTSLREFVSEPEKTLFLEWLTSNQRRWLDHLRQNGGAAGAKWIETNQPLMAAGNWDEIFLPRFVYGLYYSDHLASALAMLEQRGLASVTLIKAEATNIAFAKDETYDLTLENSDGVEISLRAERVVLGIGSPPIPPIKNGNRSVENHPACLNDIYFPSEEVTLQRIYHALSAVAECEKRNILILGSNASSLEILYLINHWLELKALVNSIVIISRTGSLPAMICDEDLGFKFTELESLKQRGSVSSLALITAIKTDVQRAEQNQINIADLFHPISAMVAELFPIMSVSEQEHFFCEHGMTFTKLMRRAGREYRTAADELAAAGLLTLEQGEFRELGSSTAGSRFVSAAFTVLNCGGFEELNESSSRLISSLVLNGLCKVNRTNRGFLVNERLEANKRLYVIGPLVGGNFNSKIRFWHAESAPRIHGLARLLADGLFATMSGNESSETPIMPDAMPNSACSKSVLHPII